MAIVYKIIIRFSEQSISEILDWLGGRVSSAANGLAVGYILFLVFLYASIGPPVRSVPWPLSSVEARK